jgi:hypothetical protein
MPIYWPNAGYSIDKGSESAETRAKCTLANLLGGTLYLALSFLNSEVTLEHVARASDSTPGLEVVDDRGRAITQQGLVLIDWEGYIANPAVKFYLVPPPDAAFPAKAVLSAGESRLHFDLPTDIGRDRPRKEVIWQKHEKLPVYLSIFPDRDGQNEGHRLRIDFTDTRGSRESLSLPVRVIDQDQARADEFSIAVDFSQDPIGFFKDEEQRATVVRAANDWAYFFADMKLQPVAAGTEKTLICGSDGFKTSTSVANAHEYQGFLLYAYGVRNPLLSPGSAIPPAWLLLKRDPAARMIRSGGEPSPYGGFQVSRGNKKPSS